MLIFRGSTLEDGLEIAPVLRQADKDELMAASGFPPEVAVPFSIRHSKPCLTVLEGEDPICIFGVTPTADRAIGTVWMVATDRLLAHRRQLVTDGPYWIGCLHAYYPVLTNYVDCRNKVHMNWIGRMGFKFLFVDPHYGAAKIPFRKFIKVDDV